MDDLDAILARQSVKDAIQRCAVGIAVDATMYGPRLDVIKLSLERAIRDVLADVSDCDRRDATDEEG